MVFLYMHLDGTSFRLPIWIDPAVTSAFRRIGEVLHDIAATNAVLAITMDSTARTMEDLAAVLAEIKTDDLANHARTAAAACRTRVVRALPQTTICYFRRPWRRPVQSSRSRCRPGGKTAARGRRVRR